MSAEEYDIGWVRIHERPDGPVSAKQEEAIRAWAADEGFPTLRGFHMRLRMMAWDYYDVLKEASP